MPAIIGAFNPITTTTATASPAPAPPAGSASPHTTASPAGIPSWVTITPGGGITVSKPPTPVGPSGGTNGATDGMVPVSGYIGYRNVINAIRNNNPPGISDSDWTLTFQPNTTFDQNVSQQIGYPTDPTVTCNGKGQLVNSSGALITAVIWIAIAGGQLAQVSFQSLKPGLNPTTTILWVSASAGSAASSATSSGTLSAPVSASPMR